MGFMYGRMVHACQIQGRTQSLCGHFAGLRADWRVARLHRHPQLRKWSCVEGRCVNTTTGEELRERTGCLSARMHGARSVNWRADTIRHSLRSPMAETHATPSRLAANAQPNNTRSHVRAKVYITSARAAVRQVPRYGSTGSVLSMVHASIVRTYNPLATPPQQPKSCKLQCLRARGACTVVYVAQKRRSLGSFAK